MADPIRVLAIMGAQRSGSTLLTGLMGEVDGAVAVGEARLLWASAVQGRPCGCLLPVPECPVWRAVLDAAVAESGPPLRDLFELDAALLRQRATLGLLRWKPGNDDGLDKLSAAYTRMYRAVLSDSGDDVVIDSSKSPAFIAFLSRIPDIDLRVVHLVRDPRGVVDSWTHGKRWREGQWHEELRALGSSRATANWIGMNVASELVRATVGRRRVPRLRFEDFLRHPEVELGSLARHAGLDDPTASSTPIVEDGVVMIDAGHVVGGNVDRFVSGPVTLRQPDTWRDRLSTSQQRWVTAATWPFLGRYRYPLR